MSPPALPDVFALAWWDRLRSLGAWLADFLREFWPIVIPVLLGLVAVYWLLPQARRQPRLWGALLGGLALVFAGWALIRAEAELAETILFYAFAGVAVVAGALLITHSNPARAALSFALVVLSTCGLFLLQAASFLMAATVIIYAGAIVVTFLFVLMLAQQEGPSDADQRSREPLLATVAGFVLLGGLLCVLHRNYDPTPLEPLDTLDDYFRRSGEAARARTVPEMEKILGEDDTFFQDFRKRLRQLPERSAARAAVDRLKLSEVLDTAHQKWVDAEAGPADKAAALRRLAGIGSRLRYGYGSLPPSRTERPLSGYSGLRPDADPREVPSDAQGKPAMPAANVAALGKSLFTDYILAVELAGTLLLVATIGAIAIAGRRAEGLR
jgi:NADH:ubiquinone oxidoreductase subunit 6 (subunit J)